MKIAFILKRDGREQGYQREKITMATWQSFWAVSQIKRKFPRLADTDEIARRAAEIEVPHQKSDKQSPLWKEAERLAKIVEDTLIRSNGSHRWKVEEIQDVVEQVLLAAGRQDAARAYILYRNRRAAERKVSDTSTAKVSDTLRLGMSENAYAAMAKRYLWKDKNGNIIETPKQAMERVATAVAAAESNQESPSHTRRRLLNKNRWRDRYLEIITSFEFVPAGCYFRGAGNKQNGSLANCFVLPVEDSIEQIFDAVKWAALIHQMGGGCIDGKAQVFTSFCGLETFETFYNRLKGGGREIKSATNGWKISVADRDITTLALNPLNGVFVKDKITEVWRYQLPASRIYTIHAGSGLEVTTSDWHPFFVYQKDQIVEKRADEIRRGDLLVSSNPSIGNAWIFNKYQNVDGIVIDENIGWLAGYILGDGAIGAVKTSSKKSRGRYLRLRLFDGQTDTLAKAADIIERLTGESLKISKDPRNKTLSLTCLNQRIVKLLQKLTGVLGPKGNALRIPPLLIKSPLSVIYALLAGLLDSDGHVVKIRPRVEFDTESSVLAEQLLGLLSLLGLKEGFRQKKPAKSGWHNMYQVRIDGWQQVGLFENNISPFLASQVKKGRLAGYHLVRKNISGFSSPLGFTDLLPFLKKVGIPTHKTEIHKHAVVVANKKFWLHRFKWGMNISVPRMIELLSALIETGIFSVEERKILNRWLTIHLSLCQATTVSRPSEGGYFYDFTTEKFHNYLAGNHGLTVVHNTGFNFSHLRPRGDLVKSGGLASGPINFMKAFDAETQIVMQGGEHRGANMGILNIDHPDIFEFIRAKSIDGEVSNFNISVGAFDKFMTAVERGSDWPLTNPRDKSIVQKIPARQLWQEIISLAHQTGDPGMIYLDTVNRSNPVLKSLGPIESTNVCIAGDTKIATKEGLITIREIAQKFPNGGLKILVDNRTGQSYSQRIAKAVYSGRKKTVKLMTKGGYSLVCTPDHKIMTRRGWVEARHLTPGEDKIYIQQAAGGFSNDDRLKIGIANQQNFPTNWNTELGQVLGWLIGDGWLRIGDKNRRVGFTFGHDSQEAYEIIEPILQNWYQKKIKTVTRQRGVKHLSFHSKTFCEWFVNLGVKAVKADQKRVPRSIFTAPKDAVVGFLQGLFSSDGTVRIRNDGCKSYWVCLTSKSRGLLEDVQLLLLQFGIKSNIYDRSREPRSGMFAYTKKSGQKVTYKTDGRLFELGIFGGFRDKFRTEIGLIISAKQRKLDEAKGQQYYRQDFVDELLSVTDNGETEVFDLTEPVTGSMLANGLYIHNCGEQPLHPFDVCNLGSINLSKFVICPWWKISKGPTLPRQDRTLSENINWSRLEEVVRISVRFLDAGIDASTYPISQIEEMAHKLRRIGLGVMGWADMLVKLGVSYNSDEGIKLAELIMKFIQQISWDESQKLSKEKVEFPLWKDSYFNSKNNPFGKNRKVRNVAVTTIAPTGTISMIADCSSGIEPYFALEYTKNVVEKQGLKYTNRYYEEAKKALSVIGSQFSVVGSESAGYQSVGSKPINRKPTNLKQKTENGKLITEIFRTSHDISPDWHVKMQAAFQKYTDNAVSKTINFSSAATVNDVENAYLLAWKLGCKGITVYRDGSREGQILRAKGQGPKAKGNTDPNSLSPYPLSLSPKLMQSQMTVTPLSQRAYRYERRQIVEESIDGHCPECGSLMEESEGCSLCRNCGYSKCSL